MARYFDADDKLVMNDANEAGSDANFAIIALIRKTNVAGTTREILDAQSNAGERVQFRLNPFAAAEDVLSLWGTDPASNASFTVPDDVWCIVAVSKATGTATPRFHMKRLDNGNYSHVDGDQSLTGLSLAGGSAHWIIGNNEAASTAGLQGDVAWAAVYARTFSDAQFEALGSLGEVLGAGPNRMWLLNQTSVTQTVSDLAGGANETSRTGTTVTTDSVPAPWNAFKESYYGSRRRRVAR